VDNRGKRAGVAGTASRGGGCGEFCLHDLRDERELDFVTPREHDDG